MAVAITKPVPCPHCGLVMDNYSTNNTTKKFDFRCKNGHLLPLSEEDYRKMLRTGKLSNTMESLAVKSGRA